MFTFATILLSLAFLQTQPHAVSAQGVAPTTSAPYTWPNYAPSYTSNLVNRGVPAQPPVNPYGVAAPPSPEFSDPTFLNAYIVERAKLAAARDFNASQAAALSTLTAQAPVAAVPASVAAPTYAAPAASVPTSPATTTAPVVLSERVSAPVPAAPNSVPVAPSSNFYDYGLQRSGGSLPGASYNYPYSVYPGST